MSEKEKKQKSVIESTFKPILTDNVEVKLLKEDERGKIYVIRNSKGSSYIKVHESIYEIIKMFDGINTVRDIEKKVSSMNIPLDLSELIVLLSEEGFIKNMQRPAETKESDLFSFKIKLFNLDTDHIAKLYWAFSFLKSTIFKAFFAVFCSVGFALFLLNYQSLLMNALEVVKPETSILLLVPTIPIFLLVEFAHELAHGVAYYHFGGKSVNIGLEFHFLIPFFYIDTPDARWKKIRENVIIFLAGPMASLFFAEVFTFLFLIEEGFRPVWASNALFWHVSTLVTLSPFIRTDGYYILQSVLKFPNLLGHGVSNLVEILKLVFRRISHDEYRTYLSQYSVSERKILAVYTLLFPLVSITLVISFVVLALQASIAEVLVSTSQILMGEVSNVKLYVLWALYVSSIVFSLIGITGSAVKVVKRYIK